MDEQSTPGLMRWAPVDGNLSSNARKVLWIKPAGGEWKMATDRPDSSPKLNVGFASQGFQTAQQLLARGWKYE